MEKIDDTSIDEICKGLPVEFKRLFQKCRQMEYEEKPDYNYFLRSIKKVMVKHHIEENGSLDWHKKQTKKLNVSQ